MQYKSICEKLTKMLMLHHICIHFQGHLPIYGLKESSTFVVFSLNCDFTWNLSMKFNSSRFFFAWLLSFKMTTLKSLIIMNGQCLGDCWIIFRRLFRNVKIDVNELYTHIQYVLLLCINIKSCCYILWTIISYYGKLIFGCYH